MKKILSFIVWAVTFFGMGHAQAQMSPDQNYVSAGFSLGSGVSAWVSTYGANGFGRLNFNPANGAPLIDSYASNNYGNVSVFSRPWANGNVTSGEGGSAMISSSFMGSGSAGARLNDKGGVDTYTSSSKSLSLSANSSGNGSASVNGGFDVYVGANGFVPQWHIWPVFQTPPSP